MKRALLGDFVFKFWALAFAKRFNALIKSCAGLLREEKTASTVKHSKEGRTNQFKNFFFWSA